MKRAHELLILGLVVSFILFSFSFQKFYYLKNNLSSLGNVTSNLNARASDAGVVSLYVESNLTCGDGICSIRSGEGCYACPVDCGSCPIVNPPSGSGSGGGGGGGGGEQTEPVVISPSGIEMPPILTPKSITLNAYPNQIFTKEIKLDNIGTVPLMVNVTLVGIENIASLNNNHFLLQSGYQATLILTILAPKSGVATGKLVFTSENPRKEIPVTINVKSLPTLMDVFVKIINKDKVVELNGNLLLSINLTSVSNNYGNVVIDYKIKGFDGKTYKTIEETVDTNINKTFERAIDTQGLNEGQYVAGVELTYDGGSASASDNFLIQRNIMQRMERIYPILIILGGIGIIFFIIFAMVKIFLKIKIKNQLNTLKEKLKEEVEKDNGK